jgi:hypothetical protein
MDHGVIPRPCRICDWLLNSFRDHFGLRQGKIVKVIVEFKVPKRHCLRPTLSIDMVQHVLWWEGQKRCSSRKSRGLWQRTVIIIKINFLGKRKWRQENEGHGTWSWTMKDGLFHGPTSMIQFLRETIYIAFGPLTRCKPNVDQDDHTPKSECASFSLFFFLI